MDLFEFANRYLNEEVNPSNSVLDKRYNEEVGAELGSVWRYNGKKVHVMWGGYPDNPVNHSSYDDKDFTNSKRALKPEVVEQVELMIKNFIGDQINSRKYDYMRIDFDEIYQLGDSNSAVNFTYSLSDFKGE